MTSLVTLRQCFVPKTKEEEEEVERSYARYKEIASTLPKEKGWSAQHLCLYKGCWLQPMLGLEGAMWLLENFKYRPDDVFLITNPKSGTTWLKAIIFSIMNRTIYNRSNHPLLTNNPHNCVPVLEVGLFKLTPIGDPEVLPSPRLLATHLPYSLLQDLITDSGCKVVYICRNHKDMFVSMWHFATKLKPKELAPLSLEDAFEMFCKGTSPFGPFWDHVLGYWKPSKERPDKILFLRYEDMKRNPVETVKKVAMFLGKPFSVKEEESGLVQEIIQLCSFENLKNLEVNKNGTSISGMKNELFFRQGKIGDWQNHLTPEMAERLDGIVEEKFKDSELTL